MSVNDLLRYATKAQYDIKISVISVSGEAADDPTAVVCLFVAALGGKVVFYSHLISWAGRILRLKCFSDANWKCT